MISAAALLFATITATSTHCATIDVTYGHAVDKQLIGCGESYPDNVLWNLDLADGTRDALATRATTGRGTVVYVIDSGVEVLHDEFRRDGGTTNVIGSLDPTVELSNAAAPKECPDDAALHPCLDPNLIGFTTHGTAVASVIAGRTAGVAPYASIVAVRVLTVRNISASQSTIWLRALDDIVKHAFDVSTPPFRTAIVNMSASPGFFSTEADWKTFETKMKLMIGGVDADFHTDPNGKRFLFVAVAGNSGALGTPIPTMRGQCTAANAVAYYPAAEGSSVDGLITVGGVDRQGGFWSGSCGGAAVDILAPAESVLCASISGHDRYRGTLLNADGTSQDVASGTSYAAPYVAGIAARILEADPTLSPVDVEQRMKESASYVITEGAPAGGRVAVLREAPAPPRRRAAGH